MLASVLLVAALTAAPPPPERVDDPVHEPISGKGLVLGGAFNCIGAATVIGVDVAVGRLGPGRAHPLSVLGLGLNHAFIPMCLHSLVPGAALRGQAWARADRSEQRRRDTRRALRLGVGLAVLGGVTFVAAKAGALPLDRESRLGGALRPSLGVVAATGFAAFAGGLALVSASQGYADELDGDPGIWAPRGWGSITSAAILGAANVTLLGLRIRYAINPMVAVAVPLRLSLAGALIGLTGARLVGEWQREQGGVTPTRLTRATRARWAGWSLIGAAPVLAAGSLIAFATVEPPGADRRSSPFGDWSRIEEIELRRLPGELQLRRVPSMVLAILAVASLQVGLPLLGYARAWPHQRRLARAETSLAPFYLPGGFGLGMSGRF